MEREMQIRTGTEILRTVEKADRSETRTIESNDRENNLGGHPGADQEQGEFTDEEFQEAVEKLKNHPGIKDNSLVVKVEAHGAQRVVLVTDFSGKVVRRIPEADLWLLMRNSRDETKGQLINKRL
jgi:uncharacterized FlaG/YvyC family protein